MESDKKLYNHKYDWLIIIGLAAIKLLVHFLTNTNFGLHRDAYLYIAQSDHLSWGYISVPPFTALITSFSRWLLGDSVFAMRFFPALTGAVNIVLIGIMVKKMGGRHLAVLLACSAYLLSPAFLHTNGMLQPVTYNHLFWLLTAFFVVKLIASRDPWYWIALGVTAGIGFMNKYSIVFIFAGLFLSLLTTTERKWFTSRYLYLGFFIAILIALPNIYWQYRHNWPVAYHMELLQESQLDHVEYTGFLLMQLLMNMNVVFIWIAGLFFFLFMKQGKAFRTMGFVFLYTTLILLLLRGKPYYTLGLYPILFAGGGIAFEIWFSKKAKLVPYIVLILMVLFLIPGLPLSLPVYSPKKMVEYGEWASKNGMGELLRWEDGNYYPLPQDYADMIGWEETVKNVADLYHSLNESEKSKTLIYASNYGQAGVIQLYRKKYDLPEPACFNGSFVFWLPDSISIDRAIMVEDQLQDDSGFFENIELISQVKDPYARDRGYVYFGTNPTEDIDARWSELVHERKMQFSRKLKRAEKKRLKKQEAEE
jgi:hypothetical protein